MCILLKCLCWLRYSWETHRRLWAHTLPRTTETKILHEPLTFIDFANYKCDCSQEMVQAVQRMAVRSRWHSLASCSALCSHPHYLTHNRSSSDMCRPSQGCLLVRSEEGNVELLSHRVGRKEGATSSFPRKHRTLLLTATHTEESSEHVPLDKIEQSLTIPNFNCRTVLLFPTLRATTEIAQVPLNVSFGLMLNILVTV